MARICILVMCGIPASGKTTCAKWLQTLSRCPSGGSGARSASRCLPATGDVAPPCYTPSNQGAQEEWLLQHPAANTSFIRVSYDEIMTTEMEEELLAHTLECSSKLNDQTMGGKRKHGKAAYYRVQPNQTIDKELSKWKKYRKEILKCVAKHIKDYCLKENETSSKTVQESPDEDIWNTFSKSLQKSVGKGAEANLAENRDVIYIIDDNMYYRSMRYEYYQLARQYSAGFAQVYCMTSVEAAQQRNSLRVSPVIPEVITNMASRIEPPGGPEAFEKHTLIIQDNIDADFISALLHMISVALNDPVPAIHEEDQEEKAAARVVCSTNLIHQTDQVLRRLVAQAMTHAKEEGQDKKSMKELAAKTNRARQSILENLRQGRLLVESRLNEELDIGKQSNSDLNVFVSELFNTAISENS